MIDRKKHKALFLYRKALGLTQADAAKIMGISRRSWVNWEQGIHPVPRSVILALEALIHIQRQGGLKEFIENFSDEEEGRGSH